MTVQGPEIRVVECLDDSAGIADWPGEDYFTLILRDYLASRAVATGPVGEADSEVLPGRDLVAFAAAWMTSRFANL